MFEEDAAKSIRPVAWAGVEEGYLAQAQLTWADTERGRGPVETVVRTGWQVYIQDFTHSPEFAPWLGSALARGYRSGVGMPLKDDQGRVFGILLIYSAETNVMTPDELGFLRNCRGTWPPVSPCSGPERSGLGPKRSCRAAPGCSSTLVPTRWRSCSRQP
jgi:hypothetical protein